MKKTLFVFVGVSLMLASMWGFAYMFHIFPWGKELEWWYLPHFFTSLAVFVVPYLVGAWMVLHSDGCEVCNPKTWSCCGGIELSDDEKCPVCGEEY